MPKPREFSALFIGGPAAGRVISVPSHHASAISVPVQPDLAVSASLEDADAPLPLPRRPDVEYRFVNVYPSMDDADPHPVVLAVPSAIDARRLGADLLRTFIALARERECIGPVVDASQTLRVDADGWVRETDANGFGGLTRATAAELDARVKVYAAKHGGDVKP